ncbi:hypothetical protein R3P38DRAFT_286689 [Favolaschia claudopus]|uniref:Secreted protein n=1 Tax=Favolaschia claudopus TaxID=2862362 RepID=A0AAV9ZPC2_9AGAR
MLLLLLLCAPTRGSPSSHTIAHSGSSKLHIAQRKEMNTAMASQSYGTPYRNDYRRSRSATGRGQFKAGFCGSGTAIGIHQPLDDM